MAAWYVGSVQYNAVPVFQISHAYNVGDFVRQISPTDSNARVFRCTTAGTSGGSEPSWSTGTAQTTNSGTAVFTEVTGNSAYGWSAAGLTVFNCLNNPFSPGDTIYVAHNHAYSTSSGITWAAGGNTTTVSKILCVSASGSVPPVAADLTTGASESSTAGAFTIDRTTHIYGININGSTGISMQGGSEGACVHENMAFTITGTGSSSLIAVGLNDNFPSLTKWKNVTVKFGHIGQSLSIGKRFHWYSGSVNAAGSIPTTLFKSNAYANSIIEGVDLSAMGANQLFDQSGNGDWQVINCKLPNSYNLYGTPGTSYENQRIDMVICDSGNANYKHERYAIQGTLTTETTNVRTGGANDGTRPFSWKVVTTSKANYSLPFECFQGSVWNASTGVSKTLTIEMLSGGTLKDNEVYIEVEYLGSSASPQCSLVTSAPSILASGSNLTSSSETWDTTGIGGATAQKVSVTFTPQMIGYVRYRICIAKISTTVWIDPKPTLS